MLRHHVFATLAVALLSGAVVTGAPARAIDLGGADDSGQDRLEGARSLIADMDYGAALMDLQEIVAEDPTSADAWNLIGYAQRHLGDMPAAGAAYEEALALDPDHLGALEYYGEWALMQNDLAAAKAMLERLIVLCPDGCEERAELDEAIAEASAAN